MKAIWSGNLSFALVNIPVKLYPATRERRLDIDYLHKKDLSPISYEKICRKEGKKVANDEIVKGYKMPEGNYVTLEDKDFKRVSVKKTNAIEIVDFVKEGEISPEYFEKPYYMEADKKSEKSYALLKDALEKTGKVGIARFTLTTHQNLGIVKPEGDMLFLIQIRYESEMRPAREILVPEDVSISERELSLAVQLINELSLPFIPEKYKDTYTQDLKEIIEGKEKAPEPTPASELTEKLKTSLEKVHKITHQQRYAH